MLAELYKEYSCGDSNKAKEALKWYLSAEADKDTDAASILAEIYNDNYDYHCILKENDIKPDRQKSYEYALKAEDFIALLKTHPLFMMLDRGIFLEPEESTIFLIPYFFRKATNILLFIYSMFVPLHPPVIQVLYLDIRWIFLFPWIFFREPSHN